MQTTNERLAELTEKIESLVSVLTPNEVKSNPELQPIVSRLDVIQDNIKALQQKEETDNTYDPEKLEAELQRFNSKLGELQQLIQKINNCQPTVEDVPEDTVFTKKRWIAAINGLLISSILSVLSLKFAVSAFTHCMGILTFFVGMMLWLFMDRYFWKGDSIGKMGQSSIGIGLASLAIVGLYAIGISIGNSYLSNPNGGDNEKPQQVIERVIEPKQNRDTSGQQQSAPARSNDVVLPERTGNTQREQ